jgi:hypothetical protein
MVYLHAKPHPYTKVGKLRGYLYSDMPLLSCQAMRQLSLPHRYLSSSLELLVKVTVSIINNLLYFDSVQSVAFFLRSLCLIDNPLGRFNMDTSTGSPLISTLL